MDVAVCSAVDDEIGTGADANIHGYKSRALMGGGIGFPVKLH